MKKIKAEMSCIGCIGSLILVGMAFSACSSTNRNPRKIFESHWNDTYSNVKVLEVTAMRGHYYRGNGIVDEHPIEEWYDVDSKKFSVDPPQDTNPVEVAAEDKQLYKDLMMDFAKELGQKIPADARIAILKFPSQQGQETKFSADVASKLEMGFVEAGRDVVDRARTEQILKEHHFQQTESALFDASSLARLGRFMGANIVVMGNYTSYMPTKVIVSARAISVETTKILVLKEKEIPLTGSGADNKDIIGPLVSP